VGPVSRRGVSELEDLYAQFPSLSASRHQITSQPTDGYNCVAWVERALDRWYEPGIFWPSGVPEPDGDEDLECYVALFRSWGFEVCSTPGYEAGCLKLALYADGRCFQHVAKQLRGAAAGWSSKAGVLHDLRHQELDALHPSGVMQDARPAIFMKRPDPGHSMGLEETGLII